MEEKIWVTDEETETLLLALARSQGDMTEEEGMQLLLWASAQRIGARMLEMVLDGDLLVTVRGLDEPVFRPAPGVAVS